MNASMKRGRQAGVCCLLLLVTPALAHAFGGTITDGNASFTFNSFGDDPSADFTVAATDRVVQMGWWYHLLGDTREFSFPDPDTETYSGNTSSHFWNDVNGGDFFSARLNTTLVEDGNSAARVHFMMTISSRRASDLTIDLINAAALEVDASLGDDSATLVHADDHIRFTSAGSSDFLEYQGIGFHNFMVSNAGPSSVIVLLNDATETDIINSGLPFGPGNATAAFKLRVVMPQFATFVVSTVLSVNGPAAPIRIGACCVPNVGCVDAMEKNDCQALGGTFQGKGISCAINPCESACCMPDQSCQFLAQQPCQAQGGTYVPNSDCSDDDGDGRANGCDGCPSDAGKVEPGACGCGVADSDTDGDGTLDCNDGCPSDSLKTVPGACGCGTTEVDGDGDSALDCQDECNNDPAKTVAGICGCGVPDTDSDGDGTADCNDECPNDPTKAVVGVCGCGVLDTDSDGDGAADCLATSPAALIQETAAGGCGTCGQGMPLMLSVAMMMLLCARTSRRGMRTSPFRSCWGAARR